MSKDNVNTLTTGKVAKLLGVSSQTIINWADDEKLESHRIGKGPRRILISSIKKLVDENEIDPNNIDKTIAKEIGFDIGGNSSRLGVEVAIGILESEVDARGIKGSDTIGDDNIMGADVLTSIEVLKRTLLKN